MKKIILGFLMPAIFSGIFLSASLVLAAQGLPNPLGDVTDPRQIVGNVIRAILGIVGSLALAVFIFGGVIWITSAGNQEKVQKGKQMIVWASFGLAVIFVSYALVTFVIGSLTGGGENIGTTPNPAGTTQQ